jgi:hypothetical protein
VGYKTNAQLADIIRKIVYCLLRKIFKEDKENIKLRWLADVEDDLRDLKVTRWRLK